MTQRRQVLTQAVNDSVKSFVRNRLAFVTTTLQNDRVLRLLFDQIKQQAKNAIILQGRCYERESVPYKALDGVVDSLSKHLASLRHTKAEALMPRNSLALVRVFPVMLE